VNNKKWCDFVSLFLFNNTYGLPVLTMDTNCPNQVFYVWLFDLQIICVKYGRETWLSPNNVIRICSLDMKHFELKTRFETWITRNDVNGVSLFQLSYVIILMAYLCSEWAQHVQTNYFMFDWSIYRIFVLNRFRKLESLQIMVFVYLCSSWGIVELIMHFETWITRNDVKGVSLFHLSYVITLTAYL
jgi:hypothetical protein